MYLKKLKEKLSKKKPKKVKKQKLSDMTPAQWNAYRLKRMKAGTLSTSPSDSTKTKSER